MRDLIAALGPEAEEAYVTIAEMLEARGLARGRAEVLVELLTLKFGPLAESVVDSVHKASADQIRTWTARFSPPRRWTSSSADPSIAPKKLMFSLCAAEMCASTSSSTLAARIDSTGRSPPLGRSSGIVLDPPSLLADHLHTAGCPASQPAPAADPPHPVQKIPLPVTPGFSGASVASRPHN